MDTLTAERREIAGYSVRWDGARAANAYAAGHWVRGTLVVALERAAREEPQRVLVIEGDTALNAGTLYRRATALAGVLASRFPAGSVVSFMLPNWHEAAIIYLATTLADMVAHPVLPSLRERDLTFMLADVKSRMLFIPARFRGHDYVAMLDTVVSNLETPPEVVVLRGDYGTHSKFNDLIIDARADIKPSLDPDAVRMIMHTSGTTGRPKGVMHSHNSLHALIRQIGDHWQVEMRDRFLVASPISHIGGSIYAFECPLLLGTTAVLMEQWNATDGIELLRDKRCTHFAGATPFLVQTLEAARMAGTRLPELKVFICGGASVPPSLVREAADYFDRAVVTRVYGSTEVPVTTVGVLEPADTEHAAETDGRTAIADIQLVEGEVCVKGPQMFLGYLHSEDEDGAFNDNGYYRTGDMGQWVDEHYLVITGRSKDIIIRNGENIAPKEVEDLLVQHPDIKQVAIIGVPDPDTGERACAVIVPSGDRSPRLEELGVFLSDLGIARFKIPERLELRDTLPTNDAGKVLKHRLKDMLVENQSP